MLALPFIRQDDADQHKRQLNAPEWDRKDLLALAGMLPAGGTGSPN
jgi:hypothetical protein